MANSVTAIISISIVIYYHLLQQISQAKKPMSAKVMILAMNLLRVSLSSPELIRRRTIRVIIMTKIFDIRVTSYSGNSMFSEITAKIIIKVIAKSVIFPSLPNFKRNNNCKYFTTSR